MSAELIIFISDEPKESWTYVHAGVEGTAITPAEKTGLASLSNGQATVIISGQNARVFARALPNLRGKDRQAAAEFAVEDAIGTTLTDHHIALLVRGDNTHIAIVSHDYMARLTAQLTAAGLKATRIFIDYDVRPLDAAAVIFKDRIIVGKPSVMDNDIDAQGYTIDQAWDDGGSYNAPIITAGELVGDAQFDAAVNLAQGRYAVRRSTGSLPSWGRAAALLIGTCAAGFLWQASTTRALNLQTAALKAETAAIYSHATGQAAPVNPALAAARRVQATDNPSVDFLTLSKGLFDTISQIDGVMVDDMQYVAGDNQLMLQILYPDFDTASRVEAIARNAGFEFQAGGVREQGGSLRGDAVLTRLGGAP